MAAKTCLLVLLIGLGYVVCEDNAQGCPRNQVYEECGGCEGSCAEPLNEWCTANCRPPGCYCVDGTVRDWLGDCIQEDECPDRTCPENQVYLDCGGCEGSCADSEPVWCTTECRQPGCYCADGAVRNGQGDCVPREECPDRTCPSKQQYLDCGGCEGTCAQPVIGPCAAYCRLPGCYCEQGAVRNAQGDCVDPADC